MLDSGLSMSFVDVFSLSFLGALIIWITNKNSVEIDFELIDQELIIIDQNDDKVDHLEFVKIITSDSIYVWNAQGNYDLNYSILSNLFIGNKTLTSRVPWEVPKEVSIYMDQSGYLFEKISELTGVKINISTQQPRGLYINTKNQFSKLKLEIGFGFCGISVDGENHEIKAELRNGFEEPTINKKKYYKIRDRNSWIDEESLLWDTNESIENNPKFKMIEIICQNPNSIINYF